jgi:hypothetical protein
MIFGKGFEPIHKFCHDSEHPPGVLYCDFINDILPIRHDSSHPHPLPPPSRGRERVGIFDSFFIEK